jgi:hypothetical protein
MERLRAATAAPSAKARGAAAARFSTKRAWQRARIEQTPRAAFTRRAEPIRRFSVRLLAEILHCLARGHIVTILLRRIYDMEVYRECENKCSDHEHSKRER